MKPLTTGLAALALVTSGALSAQGHGHGGGGPPGGGGPHGNGGGHGNGNGHQAIGSMAASIRGHGNAMEPRSTMQGHGVAMRAAAAANEHGRYHGNAMRADASMRAQVHAQGNGNGKDKGHGQPKDDRGQGKAMAARGHNKSDTVMRPNGNPPPQVQNAKEDRPGVRVLDDGRRMYSQRGAGPRFDFASADRGLINGCPPGLAKKNNGCMPPGLARQRSWDPAWWGVSSLAGGPYYYNDGYLARLGGGGILSYVPLLGGALSVGNPWPSAYAPVPVPDYYVNYYALGPADSYRYADNVLYRVDPSTSAITAIAALLTGDTFNIGQPVPAGYDVYNVPYPYRSQYADSPDAWYRYSDGYVYQIDPTTRLVTAAIELLAS